jgi:hypothetical protein
VFYYEVRIVETQEHSPHFQWVQWGW